MGMTEQVSVVFSARDQATQVLQGIRVGVTKATSELAGLGKVFKAGLLGFATREILRFGRSLLQAAAAGDELTRANVQRVAQSFTSLKAAVGGVLVDLLGLNERSGDLATRLQGLTAWVERNRAAIAAWARLIVESGRVVITTAFNVGRILGDVIRGIARALVALFKGDFRGARDVLREAMSAIAGDVGAITEGFERWAIALERVQAGAAGAAAAVAAAAGSSSAGGDVAPKPAPPGAGERPDPSLWFFLSPLSRRRHGLRSPLAFSGGSTELDDATDEEADAKAKAAQGAREVAGALTVMISSLGAAAQAAVLGSARIEAAIVGAMTQIGQAIISLKAQQLGSWAGPLSAAVGAVGGLLGAIFGGGGRHEPPPVRIDSFSQRAQGQLQEAQGELIINLPAGFDPNDSRDRERLAGLLELDRDRRVVLRFV